LLFTGVVRDISRQRRMEQALLEAQKYESLGVLAGGIAHDFNNLLTTVIGNAELATAALHADSPVRAVLEDIQLAARRAADLARQLLVYAGKSEAVILETNLTTLVEELAPLLRASVTNDIELQLNCVSGLPFVNADEVQVRQVVMNLVINASDAIGDGAGTITVSTGSMYADESYLRLCHLAPSARAGDYSYIEVTDDGPGMGSEALARIFDPFYTTKFSGRGLGLAVVLGVVRSHSGGIGVQSELGVGTTFRFLLPTILSADPTKSVT
jgi:two-component system cell cycle sensor histidine kinase/response regulator CckA